MRFIFPGWLLTNSPTVCLLIKRGGGAARARSLRPALGPPAACWPPKHPRSGILRAGTVPNPCVCAGGPCHPCCICHACYARICTRFIGVTQGPTLALGEQPGYSHSPAMFSAGNLLLRQPTHIRSLRCSASPCTAGSRASGQRIGSAGAASRGG